MLAGAGAEEGVQPGAPQAGEADRVSWVTPVLPRNVASGSFPALGSARPLSARRKRTRIGSAYSSASRFKRALMVTDIALVLVDAP